MSMNKRCAPSGPSENFGIIGFQNFLSNSASVALNVKPKPNGQAEFHIDLAPHTTLFIIAQSQDSVAYNLHALGQDVLPTRDISLEQCKFKEINPFSL